MDEVVDEVLVVVVDEVVDVDEVLVEGVDVV